MKVTKKAIPHSHEMDHEPRTRLISFQDKDKQKILGIICGPLSRNSKSSPLCFISEKMGSCTASWIVHPKRFSMIKIFYEGVSFQQFRVFNQTYYLSSSFEGFFQVKLVWVKRKGHQSQWDRSLGKWQWLGSCKWEKVATHVTLWNTDLSLWVFLFKEHRHNHEQKNPNITATAELKLP